jgi:hypothetical protein
VLGIYDEWSFEDVVEFLDTVTCRCFKMDRGLDQARHTRAAVVSLKRGRIMVLRVQLKFPSLDQVGGRELEGMDKTNNLVFIFICLIQGKIIHVGR